MKELSTEQKAKRYDEALERARDYWETDNDNTLDIKAKGTMECLFPELCESEDEKIRKEIVKVFKSLGDGKIPSPINYADIFTWLEKQKMTDEEIIFRPVVGTDIRIAAKQALEKIDIGKKVVLAFNGAYIPVNGKTVGEIDSEYDAWLEKQDKKTSWKPSKDEMDALYGLAYITNKMDDKKDEAITKLYQDLKREFFNGASYENMFPSSPIDSDINVEKQGEHKSADKVEPKFREGEWVVFNDKHESVYQIEKIENFQYTLRHILGGSMPLSFSHEDMIRAWTIQDAKDGDVLTSIGFHSNCTFIFKCLDNWELDEPNGDRAVATGYCCLSASADNIEFGVQGPDCIEVNTIKPATKIQRDLLFQKMKEAGYVWDAEKKELKKIEDKPLVIDEGKAEMDRFFTEMMLKDSFKQKPDIEMKTPEESLGVDSDTYNKIVDECVYGEQKPAWSEEDEVKINRIVAFLENLNVADNDIILKDADWLKSLKNRVLPKPADLSEDDRIFARPLTPFRETVDVTIRLPYVDDDLKPIAEFIMDYCLWDLRKDNWNQPVIVVPLFRVLDALIQRGKPYCEGE